MTKYISIASLIIIALPFTACTEDDGATLPTRKSASDTALAQQPALEFGEQWSDENEKQTADIIDINKKLLMKRSQKDTYTFRDAHPKTHGCVKATFSVDSTSLPSELRVGVFAPANQKYSAWVRFSNGNPAGIHVADIEKDVRGMAIKLMNVDGATGGSQDFVMLTSKEFFSEDASDYIDLHHALSGFVKTGFYFLTHPTQAKIFFKAQIVPANPLQVEYFSSVPYKLGSRSMKFKARPCLANPVTDKIPNGTPAPNYLRERLVSTLATRSACYEILVQPNLTLDKNPIENATLEWSEQTSPYLKVATLEIPQQTEIDSPEHLNFCENISMDPWHTLPDERPLGQINRMRLRIYPAISEFRHAQNGIPIIEPKTPDICVGETAPLCQEPKRSSAGD